MLIDLHRSEIREEWRLSTSPDGNGLSMTKREKQPPVGCERFAGYLLHQGISDDVKITVRTYVTSAASFDSS
jgi:hypothetical protein